MIKLASLAALFVALMATAVAVAATDIGRPSSFQGGFTATRPGASSGFDIVVTGAPPPAGTQEPAAVRQVVLFPRGTRFDTGAVPACHATVADLQAQGAEAVCPASSRIGTGVAEGVLNGQPVHFDLVAFNFPRRIDFAAESNGMPLKQGFFGRISGRRLVLDVPTNNGAIAPTRFEAHISAHQRAGHRYVRTPRTCPRGRRWRFVTTFTGLTPPAGGALIGSTHTLGDTARCRR
jgi:hypothetical protein